MKKFINVSNGGVPVYNDDLVGPFNADLWAALESMIPYPLDTEGVILFGCTISGGGPYNITAGVVALNRKFLRVPAVTNITLPQYIVADTPTQESRVFADSTSHPVFSIENATYQNTVPGGGVQYIAITSPADPNDRRLDNMAVNRLGDVTLNQSVFIGGIAQMSGGFRTSNVMPNYKFKTIDTTWNMDLDPSSSVLHGEGGLDIRLLSVKVMVKANTGFLVPLDLYNAGAVQGGVTAINGTSISFQRLSGGVFDSAAYNAALVRVTLIMSA